MYELFWKNDNLILLLHVLPLFLNYVFLFFQRKSYYFIFGKLTYIQFLGIIILDLICTKHYGPNVYKRITKWFNKQFCFFLNWQKKNNYEFRNRPIVTLDLKTKSSPHICFCHVSYCFCKLQPIRVSQLFTLVQWLSSWCGVGVHTEPLSDPLPWRHLEKIKHSNFF